MTARSDTFEAHRRHLLGVAYRMLGSASEAEDVVQEAWLRFASAEGLENPRGWLTTVVTRLCLDVLGSARVRRERYVGPWLPEPMADAALAGDDAIDDRRSLSMAALLLYERLTPVERAVVVLRDAFGWPFAAIADVVRKSEANCRQIHKRAGARLDPTTSPVQPDGMDARAEHLVLALLWAARTGDEETLGRLLAEDATLVSDSGGAVVAAGKILRGRDRVARAMRGVTGLAADGAHLTIETVNGQRAILLWYGTHLHSVSFPTVAGDRVTGFHTVLAPDKLAVLGRSFGATSVGGDRLKFPRRKRQPLPDTYSP